MLKKILVAALLLPLLAFGQSYPSPTFNNLTVQGTFTATGNVGLASLAAQAANTVVGNATGSSASPTAITVTGCNGAAQALQWTNGSGFGCNSNIATSGANANITSLSGLSTPLSVAQGGNGSSTLPPGRLIGVQVFSASGTYTPTTGTASVIVEVQAPGGGSGGIPATSAGQSATGPSGGAGAYVKARFTTGFSGAVITIGAVGAAGSSGSGNGGAGGTTSFGSLISCPGGLGGTAGSLYSAAGATGFTAATAAPTVTGAAQTMDSMPGPAATTSGIVITAGTVSVSAPGANSLMGFGGQGRVGSNTGGPPTGYGAGAGSGLNLASQSALVGIAGAPGVIIVYEYQ
jgi:hypothetical protein